MALTLATGDACSQTSKPSTAPAAQAASRAALPRPIALGDNVTVDEQAGGFGSKSPSTAEIDLNWPAVEKAQGYVVLRSDRPKIQFAWSSIIHAQCESNHLVDNDKVERGATYYYAIIATMDDGTTQLVANGKASSLNEDGPLKTKKSVDKPTTNAAK
jgi:hypothetical protein